MTPDSDQQQGQTSATQATRSEAAPPPSGADASRPDDSRAGKDVAPTLDTGPRFAGQPADPDATDCRAGRRTEGPHEAGYRRGLTDSQVAAGAPTPEATEGAAGLGLPRRFGDYELLEELGHGGMGVVFKARQRAPERLVALKMIRAGELAGAEAVRRFRQEADEAARLDHPHIVPVYEVGEHQGHHFFTMKLVEGGSLGRHLGRYKGDPRAAARLVAAVARAVHHAHQRQLLHRDLKPGNVLLDAAGQPHVADFGLAKRLGGGGEASQSAGAGTPEYMAPEQARGEARLTTAADVYGLGGILYALLAGRPPFRAASPWETIKQVLSAEPPPPSRHRPGCPRDLETICRKCLEKEPGRRYGSAEALAEDLERWLAGEPIQARTVGRLERGRLWCKRNPGVAGSLAALAAALLLGAGLSTGFAIKSDANYRDARQREAAANSALSEVQEREKQLGEANARLEGAAARGLLLPLGHSGHVVSDTEIESLWELARSSERLRLLFVEQGLQQPATAGQLRSRAEMAIHAAVGLDPSQRQRIERVLLTRLQDPRGDFRIRQDCVFIGLALEDWGPEFGGSASRLALEAMGKTNDPYTLAPLAQAVAELAPRLGPEESAAQADTACRLALDGMAKPAAVMGGGIPLAQAVAELAPRLRPEQADAACRRALEAMARPTNPLELPAHTRAVAALAPRLGPEQADAACRRVLEAMGKSTSAGDQWHLADAVVALAPRLGPEQADAACRRVLEAMGKFTALTDLQQLADAVAALAPRLGPEQADAACRLALAAMSKTTNPFAAGLLARSVAALAPQLPPGQAAAHGDAACRLILKLMGRTIVYSLRPLFRAVAALAPRLGPEQADAASGPVLEAMGKSTSLTDLEGPAEAVAALAPRLRPEQADAACRLALAALGRAQPLPLGRVPLVRAVAALAPRLGPERADAARRLALEAMTRTAHLNNLEWTEAVAELAPWLGPEAADAACRRLLDGMPQTVLNPLVRVPTGRVLAALAPRLRPERADAACRVALAAMSKTTMPDPHRLSEAVAALLIKPLPEGASRQAPSQATPQAVGPLPGRYTEQQLVDFLKIPTCRRAARDAVLRQLGWQCGRTFAHKWEFVAWARQHRPDLDLTSPPVRSPKP